MATITIPMTKSSTIIEHGKSDAKAKSLEQLAWDLRERKEGALEALIKKTEKACFHLALSILKDPDLSRDALQDSYFTVYQRIGQLREAGAVKTWLFRIVHRSCTDIIRKRKREIETDLTERDDLMDDSTPSNDPSRTVANQTLIRETFDELPEIDRQTLALREVCSMSYEEMSQVLSVPVGTVRSRLAKARKRFIKAYRKEQK